MPGWLQDLLRWIIEHSLGSGSLIPDLSPREQFLGAILFRLLHPDDFRTVMTSDAYLKGLQVCLWLGLAFWVIELLFRIVAAIREKNPAEHAKQWLYTGAFLCMLVPVLPALFIAVRLFFDAVGRWLAGIFVGTMSVEEFVRTMLRLSDDTVLNALLTIVQVVLLFVLWIFVVIVPFSLWISLFFLVLGVSLRFIPGVGEGAFIASLNVTIYAFFTNAVVLVTMTAFVGAGRLFYPNDHSAQALMNTAGMLAAVALACKLTSIVSATVKAAIDGTVSTLASLKNNFNERPEPQLRDREQVERQKERSLRGAQQQVASSDEISTSGEAAAGIPDQVQGEAAGSTTERPQRRSSSTSARSQRPLTDPPPDPVRQEQSAKQTAADRGQKVEVAVDVISVGATVAGQPEIAIAAQAVKPAAVYAAEHSVKQDPPPSTRTHTETVTTQSTSERTSVQVTSNA